MNKLTSMLVKLFLAFNKLFKQPDHPFNKSREGVFNLNYSDAEYKSAKSVFASYNRFGDFLDLVKNKTIADFCCGGGGKSIYLAENGVKKIYGIDWSDNFINQANILALEKKVKDKCCFLKGDVANTKLPPNHFDIVYLNDSIEHLDDIKATLLEAKRILKVGGMIYINFEAYYYFFGHHLWDALPIPWLHVFTTEKFRIKLYKKRCESFADGKERIRYRISKNKERKEYISYLNRVTIKDFKKIINDLKEEGLDVSHLYFSTFNNPIFKILAKIPVLNELFLSTIYCVLKKNR